MHVVSGIDPTLRREQFEYDLPPSAIAQAAVEPRDAARLLDTRDLTDHLFSELPMLLQPGDLLVVNETRVRRARLTGRRVDTGGSVELLVLDARGDGSWQCLCRPARRLRPGVEIAFAGMSAEILEHPVAGRVPVRFTTSDESPLEAWFERTGELPLPPYFRGALDDPERYQTVFAQPVGSAAAPTAGLHFTPDVVAALRHRGVSIARVELRVGLDTFRPVSTERLADHVMHTEQMRVGPDTVEAVRLARHRRGRVIAVGTTVTRALEAAAAGDGNVREVDGATDLFIAPGYRFEVVDGLITNFHVPGSTLVALVAAVLDRWREVYETALARGYRFLSFGDAMYLETGRARD